MVDPAELAGEDRVCGIESDKTAFGNVRIYPDLSFFESMGLVLMKTSAEIHEDVPYIGPVQGPSNWAATQRVQQLAEIPHEL